MQVFTAKLVEVFKRKTQRHFSALISWLDDRNGIWPARSPASHWG